MVDAVFALLDDQIKSFFSKAPKGTKFCDGATTAHIASHVGILQRGATKLDREGRDYWIKPLRELGAIVPIYFDPKSRAFVDGHPVPKSPNSAYRLAKDFVSILKASEGSWEKMLDDWASAVSIRARARLQAEAEERASGEVESSHAGLVDSCRELYVPRFLADFKVVYVDIADGERITTEDQRSLDEAGLSLSLADAMPDILLWNPIANSIWIIEAVTSDGEVDAHKVVQLTNLARHHGKTEVGFTTAYGTWKDAARRQGKLKNIAPQTYIWIREDPSKHFHVVDMSAEFSARGLTI